MGGGGESRHATVRFSWNTKMLCGEDFVQEAYAKLLLKFMADFQFSTEVKWTLSSFIIKNCNLQPDDTEISCSLERIKKGNSYKKD